MLEKDELLKKVWPETFVEEANLASNISQLRKVLWDGENGLIVNPARLIFQINLATLVYQKL